MNSENLIPLQNLCTYYEVDMTFFTGLDEIGLIEIKSIEEIYYISPDKISDIDRIIRLHNELNMNMEGIDIVLNMLQRIDELQQEVNSLRNRLRLYEK